MITQNTIGQCIELQIVNGGGYLTESYPTNFPHFYKRKMLTATEKITDFREVTATEKQALESKAANFNRPPQSFIDQWNVACGGYGCWNESTGYFELNGLKDITYSEAIEIERESSGRNYLNDYAHPFSTMRTFFAINNSRGEYGQTTNYAFYKCSNLKVLRFANSDRIESTPTTFTGCNKLERIIGGKLEIPEISPNRLLGLTALREVTVRDLYGSLNLGNSPYLELPTARHIIQVAIPAQNITFTVHPLVYAKIMGTSTEAMTEEEKAQWEALLPLAQERNVTIATV